MALGKGVAHHIGNLVHMHLEWVNMADRNTRLFSQPMGKEVHIQQLVSIGLISQPILGQHLNRMPIQLLLFPRRGGNDIKILLTDTPLFQQLAHQPAHINQQTIQFGGVGGSVHSRLSDFTNGPSCGLIILS